MLRFDEELRGQIGRSELTFSRGSGRPTPVPARVSRHRALVDFHRERKDVQPLRLDGSTRRCGHGSYASPSRRILLVENHASFRQALAFTLDEEPEFEVVGQAGSMAEVRRMPGEAVDVAVVDLGLPDGDRTEIIPDLRASNPEVVVLVLTASIDQTDTARAVEADAAEATSKAADLDEIITAIKLLLAGKTLLPLEEVSGLLHLAAQERERDLEAQRKTEQLTPREREVLQELADGLGRKEIDRRLQMAVETEHTHMSRILKKLGVHSRLQDLVSAVRYSIVEIIAKKLKK